MQSESARPMLRREPCGMIFEPEGMPAETFQGDGAQPPLPRKSLTLHLGRLMFLVAEVGRLTIRTYYLPKESPVSIVQIFLKKYLKAY